MKVVLLNDPILRRPTDPVTRDELDYINSIVPEMIATMKREEGAGLAANQVGISKRFFIMRAEGETVQLFINPEIKSMGPLLPFEEGCLSIPGTSAETSRAQEVKVKYLDYNFEPQEREYKGFDAAAVQHEVDHLDGKLYIDQLPLLRRNVVLNKHKKFRKKQGI